MRCLEASISRAIIFIFSLFSDFQGSTVRWLPSSLLSIHSFSKHLLHISSVSSTMPDLSD